MKLLTQEILNKFKKVGSQENIKNPQIIVKFFHPASNYTWFATEYDQENQMFFGMVHGHDKELGYFSLKELANVFVRGLKVERDMYFGFVKKLSEI